MYKQRPVNYDPTKGMMTVVVDSGYVTQGRFSLHITNGPTIIKVGEGRFDDAVPDIFLLPIPPAELQDWMLIMIGSYSPAAGHAQIKLDYIFQQQAAAVDREEIRHEGTYLSAQHNFTF